MADQRTYTGGRFALDVDGFNVGTLKSFGGLGMEAEIATVDLGRDSRRKKQVARVKWTPGRASIGLGMGKGMYGWIKGTLDTGNARKSGQFTTADFNYKAQSSLAFTEALLTGITFPKLDGSSKDPGYVDVRFEAGIVRWAKAGGEDIRGKLGPKQKQWLCSNFKVEIGSLPCARVATVDSFTWSCALAVEQPGRPFDPAKRPVNVTVPDLRLSISSADYQPWFDAARKWFVDGRFAESDEMNGRIVFLSPDMKTELGELGLDHVGFKKFVDDDSEANADKVQRFNVELYVEKMTFAIKEYDV